MATGAQHARASRLLALPAFLVTAVSTGDVTLGAVAALGCFAGVPLSPDLDICGITYSERHMVLKWGPFGWLWYVYWLPYGRMLRHRHWLSHMPIIGTAGRLLYLFGPLLWVGTAVWPELWPWLAWGLRVPHVWVWVIWLGVSDLLHWAMDYW